MRRSSPTRDAPPHDKLRSDSVYDRSGRRQSETRGTGTSPADRRWAVRRMSQKGGEAHFGSQLNGGFGADSGPSRGDRCRRATRPSETIAVCSATTALDPKRKFQVYERICGTRRKADLADRLAASYRRVRTRSRRPTPESLTAPVPPRSPAFPALVRSLRAGVPGPHGRRRSGRRIGRAWLAKARRAVRSCACLAALPRR